jgi:hypothetical protein
MMNYSNKEFDRVELTIGELRTLVRSFENADKNQKVAIVRGVDSLGGEYVEISRVRD